MPRDNKLSGETAASLVLCAAADAARSKGEISKAVSLYSRALPGLEALSSDSVVLGLAHFNLAECLEVMGRHAEAALHCSVVTKILRRKGELLNVTFDSRLDLAEHPHSA